MVTAALLVLALSAATAAAPPQSSPVRADTPPVSAEHVSRGLQVQEPLRVPPPPPPAEPTFRMEVEGKPHLETALEAVRRELAGDTYPNHLVKPLYGMGGPAGGSVDMLPAILGLVHKIQKARYERAERQIHADVTAELAVFCAANDCSTVNEGLLLPDSP